MTTPPPPFEPPEKTDMRARCAIAIDQAGHTGVDLLVTYPLPSGPLRGGIKGDLQSLDNDGVRYCYYLRPQGGTTLPKWLANLAASCHELDSVKLYVVVTEVTPQLEKACKVAGAGLLCLTDDHAFMHVIDFDANSPAAIDAEFEAKLTALRRALESKLELHKDLLQKRLGQVVELTKGMPDEDADRYADSVERQYLEWDRWADGVSERLDAAFSTREFETLLAIEKDITAGPLMEDDI